LSKKPSEPAPIKQRFIACVQSTGRVGKSMVADGILSWLTFAGISHAAIDTDVQHLTLSDRYKMHLLDATSSEDEFEQLLENLPESPTLIVDFPGEVRGLVVDRVESEARIISDASPDCSTGSLVQLFSSTSCVANGSMGL
jgi:hypothetical protein